MGNSKVYQICTCADKNVDQENIVDTTICEDFQAFQSEKWYKLQYKRMFDPNKFIFLYCNYKQTQSRLHNLWEIFDLNVLKDLHVQQEESEAISEELKFAIRRGVPISLYKAIIEGLFCHKFHLNPETQYKKVLQKNKKIHTKMDKKQKKSNELRSHIFLNAQGVKTRDKIMELLSVNEGQLKYNPYIEYFISLFLIIQREEVVYLITCQLIKRSFHMPQKRQESLRWHFTLNQHQFQKLCQTFHEKTQNISPTIKSITEYFESKQIRKLQLFQEIIGKFFFGFLPFRIIMRIFIQFMNEGVRVIFRIYYSILKLSSQVIYGTTSIKQISRAIKSKLLTFFTTQKSEHIFFRYAFDLCIDSLFMSKLKQIELEYSKKIRRSYFLPVINGASSILSRFHFEQIWYFVPLVIKHYDTKLVYSTQFNRKNVQQMVDSIIPYNYTFIIIQTDNDTIFGVFLAQKLKNHKQIKKSAYKKFHLIHSLSSPCIEQNKQQVKKSVQSHKLLGQSPQMQQMFYFGSPQSFVFTVKPNLVKYHSTGENILFCYYSNQNFVIGGPPQNPALQLDESLSNGISKMSKTYHNKPLHGNFSQTFRIKHLQCFILE